MTDEGTPQVRRLRSAESEQRLLAIVERLTTRKADEASATIDFARNAKGETQIAVKVTDSPDSAYSTALRLYENACARFPRIDTGMVTNDGPPAAGADAEDGR